MPMTSAIDDRRSGQQRELLEEVAPAIVDLRFGDDSWHAQQGEDEISRTEDGCARFRGPTELNGGAAHDLGSGCGVDNVTQWMPAVVVVPGQRDEAKGQTRHTKHMTAEAQTRR